jgi:RNA polymerase sigma factor (sigma-70 family)
MTGRHVPPDEGGEATSRTLIELVKRGDPRAWTQFSRTYTPLIHRWLRRFGLRHDDAEDVCQDIMIQASKNIGTFDHHREGATFRGWLRTIVEWRAYDLFRALRKRPVASGGSTALERLHGLADRRGPNNRPSDPESGGLRPEDGEGGEQGLDRRMRQAVETVLARCSRENREAFLRVVAGGEKAVDVARDQGRRDANAVYLAVSHVTKRIREEFDRLGKADAG